MRIDLLMCQLTLYAASNMHRIWLTLADPPDEPSLVNTNELGTTAPWINVVINSQ